MGMGVRLIAFDVTGCFGTLDLEHDRQLNLRVQYNNERSCSASEMFTLDKV